jgi:hypothetical protein
VRGLALKIPAIKNAIRKIDASILAVAIMKLMIKKFLLNDGKKGTAEM